MLDKPVNTTCMGNFLYLAVAGGVSDGVFVLSRFPRYVLNEILDLIVSVSEGLPTCFLIGRLLVLHCSTLQNASALSVM